MDLVWFPASLVTLHSYTAVSSTVGAITTRDPEESCLKKKDNEVKLVHGLTGSLLIGLRK